jgi:hypothetical protein
VLSDELEGLHAEVLDLAHAALARAERLSELADELDSHADRQYAEEQEPTLLVLRKGIA